MFTCSRRGCSWDSKLATFASHSLCVLLHVTTRSTDYLARNGWMKDRMGKQAVVGFSVYYSVNLPGSIERKYRKTNVYIRRPTRCTVPYNVSLFIIKYSTFFVLFSPSSGATFWSCISQLV